LPINSLWVDRSLLVPSWAEASSFKGDIALSRKSLAK